jgi:hypothetical protein
MWIDRAAKLNRSSRAAAPGGSGSALGSALTIVALFGRDPVVLGVEKVIKVIIMGGRLPPTNGDPPTKFYHVGK